MTLVGLEPIYMQVSGGHLLAPVQKLVPSFILSSHPERIKCKSSPTGAYCKLFVDICKICGILTLEVITLTKEIEIGGCVEVPMELSCDEFIDEFIAFIESYGWYFGGGFHEIIDDYYINPDGSRGNHVLDGY